MKHFQDYLINTFVYMLKIKPEYYGEISFSAYKYAICKSIDKYSNTYHFYQSPNDLYDLYWGAFAPERINYVFDTILISDKAHDFLMKYIEMIQSGDSLPKLNKHLHLEHITPMSSTFSRMITIPDNEVNYNSVKNCFRYCKVILITKEETDILDGKNKRIMSDDINFYKENFKAHDMTDVILGNKLKNSGNGLFRVSTLIKNGVSFVTGKNKIKLSIPEVEKVIIADDFSVGQIKRMLQQ